MNTNHAKEDLFHSLPDYISNHIDDKNLLREIEKEIEINPEFKNVYENMKFTFSFLDSAELEAPHENYFNNLSVRINDRVNKNSEESLWDKIGLFWKILIPVISITIIAILLYNYSNNDPAEIKLTSTTNEKIETNEKVKDNEVNTQTEKIKIPDEENSKLKDLSKSDHSSDKVRRSHRRMIESQNPVNTSESKNKERNLAFASLPSNSIAENVDDNADIEEQDDVLYINDSEEDYEDEFLELTPEEQHEILENLNKSQI